MLRIRRFSAAVAITLTAAGLMPLHALPSEKERWIRVETDNFTLIGNTGKSRTLRFAASLERFRATLTSFSSTLTTYSPVPTIVYVFKNEASFKPYKWRKTGDGEEIAGYFIQATDGNFAALNAAAQSDPLPILYHEYGHFLAKNNIDRIPLWLDEGLAEFFSTFAVLGRTAQIGQPMPEHLRTMRQRQLPLETLLAIDTASKDYLGGHRRGIFYAQSWTLVHYILTDAERKQRLEIMLEELREGAGATDAFKSSEPSETICHRSRQS